MCMMLLKKKHNNIIPLFIILDLEFITGIMPLKNYILQQVSGMFNVW